MDVYAFDEMAEAAVKGWGEDCPECGYVKDWCRCEDE